MWKDFFLGRAYFSNSLDFKLPTLLKLSQTRGRFMFQLKDQRDLSNKHVIPPQNIIFLMKYGINTSFPRNMMFFRSVVFSKEIRLWTFAKLISAERSGVGNMSRSAKTHQKQPYWQIPIAVKCSDVIYKAIHSTFVVILELARGPLQRKDNKH